jgi:putative membrane protein
MPWLTDWYEWILAGHIVSVIAWMAGMFYLPRLFVYHAGVDSGSDQSETFKTMEGRLLRAIINPSMVLAWSFGILMVFTPGIVDWGMGWPWVKAGLVIGMTMLHGFLVRWCRHFANDGNQHTARFYRWINEAPTVMVMVVVVMVVVKPF